MEDNNDDDDEDEYATTMGSDTDRGERRRRFVQRWKRPKQLPASKKEVFNAFDLATTNQLLSGKINPSPAPSKLLKKLMEKGETREKQQKGWMKLVASKLFSARVSILPRPQEFDPNVSATDPRRGLFKDFGGPSTHLCKLVRKHLLGNIINRLNLIRPKINTNLGHGKPTKKDLDAWKMARGRLANHQVQAARKRQRANGSRRGVVSTKRMRVSARYRPCHACGDFHFRRSCATKDLRINLMVKQIHQKAAAIQDNMDEAWDKLESLEEAYHDMLTKVHRLQSNKVCLGQLTGEDYPGELHPEQCPCVEQKEKEELDKQQQEERERRKRQEEEIRQKEAQIRREKERERRERILETRKKKFYSQLQQPLAALRQQQERRQQRIQESVVRFKKLRRSKSSSASSNQDDTEMSSAALQDTQDLDQDQTKLNLPPGILLKTSPTDLTRLEASRRRPRMDDIDLDMQPRSRLSSRPSLLSRIMEKSDGRHLDLVVMDGSIKSLGYNYVEDGGMFQEELTVKDLDLEEEGEDATADDQPSEMASEEEAVTDAFAEEEKEAKEVVKVEATKTEEETREEESRIPFGQFLDLMEVF